MEYKSVKKSLVLGVSAFAILIVTLGASFWQDPDPDLEWFSASHDLLQRPANQSFFDVIVVGGEPEGVAAAVSAAKNGASVLLLERRDGLGGLFTYGMLNYIDMNYGPEGELLTRGTFAEFFNRVKGEVFDVEEAKQVFAEMVGRYPNIVVMLNARFKAPVMQGDTIIGVTAERQGEEVRFYGSRIIDATQDADVAAAAGVPFTLGAEDMGEKDRYQAATLIFRLRGVRWDLLRHAVEAGRIDGAVVRRAAWGFASVSTAYRPSNPRLRLRGLNIGRQKDGTVLINALQIFGVDGLDEDSKREAIELAKKELPAIVSFLRRRIPGFAAAELDGTAQELYIRETRHIKAEYQLDINDVVFNRDFPDRIAHGSYPVDVQVSSPEGSVHIHGRPVMYSIPFRSLVPLQVENLLVVGRSGGYTHLAAGSVRVVPVGMATGDAAGTAAAYSLRVRKSFRELANDPSEVREIQELLVKHGAYLKEFNIPNPLADHWAYRSLQFANRWGLIVAGYNNEWKLGLPITRLGFYDMTANAIRRALPGKAYLVVEKRQILGSYLERKLLTRAEAARLLLTYLGYEATKLGDAVALSLAEGGGLLPVREGRRNPNELMTYADAYFATEKLYIALSERD